MDCLQFTTKPYPELVVTYCNRDHRQFEYLFSTKSPWKSYLWWVTTWVKTLPHWEYSSLSMFNCKISTCPWTFFSSFGKWVNAIFSPLAMLRWVRGQWVRFISLIRAPVVNRKLINTAILPGWGVSVVLEEWGIHQEHMGVDMEWLRRGGCSLVINHCNWVTE